MGEVPGPTDDLRRMMVRRASWLPLFLSLMPVLGGCEPPDPELVPDEVLQTELGLSPDDRVHTVWISTGSSERADPPSVSVKPGEYVQFVSSDRLVHEVAFRLDSLDAPGRAFLVRTGQNASTPLLERDARFVVSFVAAPPGRYPYGLAGNRAPGGGEIVVEVEAR